MGSPLVQPERNQVESTNEVRQTANFCEQIRPFRPHPKSVFALAMRYSVTLPTLEAELAGSERTHRLKPL